MRAQEEDMPQQQSFITMLYANDSFLKMKETLTEEMLQNNQNITQLIKEQKSMISEADRELEELQRWRASREKQQREQLERQRKADLEIQKIIHNRQSEALADVLKQEQQTMMELVRRGNVGLSEIENLKLRKESNTNQKINESMHS